MRRNKLFKAVAFTTSVLLLAGSIMGCAQSGQDAPAAANNTSEANAPEAADAPAEQLVIEMATASKLAPSEMYYIAIDETGKKLEELTDGAVRFDIKGDGQLGQDGELAEGISLGTIDGCVIPASVMASTVKSLGILDMPYLFTSSEQCFDFIDSSPVIEKMEQEILESYNAVVVGWCFNGFRNMLNNARPISKLEDFSGLKIRIMESPVYMGLFQAVGANPTPMSYAEALTGLEQGTVDGMEVPIANAYNQGAAKLVKYIDLTNHTATLVPFMVHRDVYAKLSAEQQDMLMQSGEYAEGVQRKKLAELEEEMLSELEADGNIIGREVDKDAIQQAVLPMYNDFREQLGADMLDETLAYLGIDL